MPFLRHSVTKKGVDSVNKKLVAKTTSLEGSKRITSNRSLKFYQSCNFREDLRADVDIIGMIEITENTKTPAKHIHTVTVP